MCSVGRGVAIELFICSVKGGIIGKSAPRHGVLHCCAGLQHLTRRGHPPRFDIACGGGSEAAAEAAAAKAAEEARIAEEKATANTRLLQEIRDLLKKNN